MKDQHYRLHRFEFLNIMLVLILILSADLFSQLYQPTEKDWAIFDVNNISAYITNHGSFFRHPTTGNSGFEWPKGSGLHAIYASGLWVAGLVDGDARATIAEYSYEYNPGTIDAETHLPNDPADSTFRVYKILKGFTNSWDYQNWPYWDGAPLDEYGEPLSIGDQTLWAVFNDADTSRHTWFESLPLGIEVQQTVFGDRTPSASLFIRWLVINKSPNYLDSVYLSIWSDPDIGENSDDFIGCDTVLNLGYCYNSSDYDDEYGDHPPAVGFQILQGPLVESLGDSGIFSGWKVSGTKNFKITSFVYYNTSSFNNGGPTNAREAWYFMQSRWRDGSHITYGNEGINPNNPKTNYVYSGDPVSGTGWIDSGPGERRFMMSSGPFNLAPGDSNEMVVAAIIARGSSNLNSVTELKRVASALQTAYSSVLYKSLRSYRKKPEPIIGLKLFQNYPNPFNNQTTIKYELPINRVVRLKIYNILGERVALLVNGRQEPGTYTYTWDATGYPSGIYFVQLNVAQYQLTKKILLIK